MCSSALGRSGHMTGFFLLTLLLLAPVKSVIMDKPVVPPDGGWGWIVVLGVALSNSVTQSVLSVFGLLFADRLEDLNEGTTGAAVLNNLVVATTSFTGLIIGPLLRRYTYRAVALVGGTLTSLGMILTSFTRTMTHMIITYSIIVGFGLGLLSSTTFVVVNAYFVRARGRAVGLAMAGTGLGQMLMPQAVRMLLEVYCFDGTVLILGAVSLHSLVGALLFHPVSWHAEPEAEREPLRKRQAKSRKGSTLSVCSEEVAIVVVNVEKENLSRVRPSTDKPSGESSMHKANCSVCSKDDALLERDVLAEKTTDVSLIAKSKRVEEQPQKESRDSALLACWKKTVSMFDLDLLRDLKFVSLVVGLAAVYTAGTNFAMVFPFFLSNVGLSRKDVALCMSLLSGTDIACRLLLPPITDKANIKSRNVFTVGALLLAACRSVLALQTKLSWLITMSAICGFVRGMTTVNFNLSISESCSHQKLPAALGINMVLKGISTLLFGPLIGWIRDETGSYPLCIHSLSVLIVVPIIIWLLEFIILRKRGDR